MIAVDTNILVYAESPADPELRHEAAARLLTRLGLIGAIMPTQVLAEFANVSRRKQLASPDLILSKLGAYATVFRTPPTNCHDVEQATAISARTGLQFVDALIIAVAASAGATMLLSEDMQDGLQVEGLTVLNPFNAANSAAIADQLAI